MYPLLEAVYPLFSYKTRRYTPVYRLTEFFPALRRALLSALTLPATTCTVERSFSILRRVKTWLRSTMADERVSGLCLLSVHREFINNNKSYFMNEVIDILGRDARRLQFLFKE